MSMQALKLIAVLVTVAMSSQISFGQTSGRIRDPLSAIKNSFSQLQSTERKNEEKTVRETPANRTATFEGTQPVENSSEANSDSRSAEVVQFNALAASKAREEVVLVQTPAVPPATSAPQFGQQQIEIEREIVVTRPLGEESAMQGAIHEIPYVVDTDPMANYPKFGVNTGHLPVGSAGLFTFSSARNKRKPFGTSDFDAIPSPQCACDEWCNFCDCGKCGNDLGLDIFRRKPCHHKGNCEGCNDCPPLPRHRTNAINRSSLGPSQ